MLEPQSITKRSHDKHQSTPGRKTIMGVKIITKAGVDNSSESKILSNNGGDINVSNGLTRNAVKVLQSSKSE
jgi:hypothetical protein